MDDKEDEVDGSLETVRVLHQTVVSLRSALEQSKNELHQLREQVSKGAIPGPVNQVIESLSIENHVLRRKIVEVSKMDDLSDNRSSEERKDDVENDSDDDVFEDDKPEVNGVKDCQKDEGQENPKFSKGDSEDSEEVDDIELIFTTEDTKELNLQEDLVSFDVSDHWKHSKNEDDVPLNLKQTWSHSVLVETDISKCGVIDENEPPNQYARRNTLPTPLPYKPIIHREIIGGSKSHLVEGKPGVKFSVESRSPRTVRPILVEKNIEKQESEAQTDITAVPVQWRSESFLAHNKASQIFTTLPSKFQVPFGQLRKQSLRLSEKTQEARRVLLSDINFTSMVPELSRSADHLCHETSSLLCKYPRAFSYMKNPDMASPGGKGGWSPCDCGHRRPSWDYGGSSASFAPSDVQDVSRRRHSMRPSLSSLDASCWSGGHPQHRPVWASVPSSPTHAHRYVKIM
ncbi:hypothetical protein GE061_010717 [Apolygus lucorum]|uniref:Uncharacterized protein n=1 Tax=Apolygus lucorum TaxID=248454 RepID=A0A6A4KAN2_APOLU|nr:hypothetical protein GE061_010717 [Apolygus lucorum]